MQILVIKDAHTKIPREATNGEAEGFLSQGFAVEVVNEDGTTSPFVPAQPESAVAPEPEQAAEQAEAVAAEAVPAKKATAPAKKATAPAKKASQKKA